MNQISTSLLIYDTVSLIQSMNLIWHISVKHNWVYKRSILCSQEQETWGANNVGKCIRGKKYNKVTQLSHVLVIQSIFLATIHRKMTTFIFTQSNVLYAMVMCNSIYENNQHHIIKVRKLEEQIIYDMFCSPQCNSVLIKWQNIHIKASILM
jgi:hypothetical protein